MLGFRYRYRKQKIEIAVQKLIKLSPDIRYYSYFSASAAFACAAR